MNSRTIPSFLSGFFWLLAVALVILFTWKLQGEAGSFIGIAEPSEVVASVESAAEVVEIRVLPGQRVRAGDTLVRLSRPELDLRISELSRSLQGTVGKAVLTESDTRRRIAEAQAAYQARSCELKAEIQSLSEERSRNLALVSAMQGSASSGASSNANASDPLLMRIRSLQNQEEVERRSNRDLVALLQESQGTQRQSTGVERSTMERELSLLRVEVRKLCLLAQSDGVIGSVNYRVGEKVAPFAPILTFSSSAPATVHGYIHESAYSDIALGDSLWVSSSGGRAASVRGVVVGVGSRIVEFPARLRKAPQIPLWGREVTVRLPVRNPFLLGEMVSLERGSGLWGTWR